MSSTYLHQRKDFESLIRTLSAQEGILDALIEKDYWIMHALYSMKKSGLEFALKGGTSLSKGFGIIDRFSEDIDLRITPPKAFIEQTGIKVNENPKSSSQTITKNRMQFFDWLTNNLNIDGIEAVRDIEFDDSDGRNGGIRLKYKSYFGSIEGLKDGILLETGFAKVTPNKPIDISSWMYNKSKEVELRITDNRALNIPCYHPGYTLVEKLQTIATKFRGEQEAGDGKPKVNFMRQYYDIYKLLQRDDIQEFINTEDYQKHKLNWFPKADLNEPLAAKEAFLLNDKKIKADFRNRYTSTANLYYKGQPDFEEVHALILANIQKLG